MVEKITQCRFCASEKLDTFLTLRDMPRPNAVLEKPGLHEEKYPLAVCRCLDCGLVQLTHMVDPETMFSSYPYFSAMSKTMMAHLDQTAGQLMGFCPTPQAPLVIDIGSNDGSFLRCFQKYGATTLGVDPAANIAAQANAQGLETFVDFFSHASSQKIREKYGQADLIVGANVFAHIDNLADVFRGVDVCLKPKGVLTMEFPYFVDLVEQNEFDTIYHEHRFYFLVKPVQRLLQKCGFEIFDIQHFPIHGGTLRLYIQRSSDRPRAILPRVAAFLQSEEDKGMYEAKTYADFAARVHRIRTDLLKTLADLKAQGKKIVGYGASAKGNVLLNFCGIGPETIDYIVDNTPSKQGRYTPGTHIPIVAEDRFGQDDASYALMLIWNFKDEVLKKQQAYRDKGGKFILPIPKVEII